MRRQILVFVVLGLILTWSPAVYCSELQRISADTSKGFSWPYYLYIPDTITFPPVLFVEPNNTGTVSDDPAYHDAAAKSLIQSKNSWANDL